MAFLRWSLVLVVLAPAFFNACTVAVATDPDIPVWREGRSRRVSSNTWIKADRYDRKNNRDRPSRVEPGETYIMADLRGPGVITHIWMTFLHEPHRWARDGAANHQEMLFRIFYDGRPEPDVEAPVGEFFASCFGRRMEVISDRVIVEDGDSYNCFWKMPFRESIRIEVVNQSTKPIRLLYNNVDWIQKPSLPPDTMYFCARYRQEYPAINGQDYLVLDAEGKGYYVGTVYAVRTRSPSWFGEGDELIYVDGEQEPSIRGTGTEDYFLSAWGLKQHSTPYFGVPYLNQHDRIIGQKTCSYRWHVHDPLVFTKGIKVTFETFGWISADENEANRPHSWNEREDDFCSVAYWYQIGPSKKFCTVPPAAERKLPSIDRVVVWGKDALKTKKHGAGRAVRQGGANYLESGGQLLLLPTSQGEGWVEYTFTVREKEPLRLLLELTRSYDFGIYQPILNGVELRRPLDLYRAETDLWEFHIMDFWPDPGDYTLRLQCVGKNPASSGHGIGVNSIRLRERRPRVKAFGYDRDKDWRRRQVLYR
jgi:hypothetical protein